MIYTDCPNCAGSGVAFGKRCNCAAQLPVTKAQDNRGLPHDKVRITLEYRGATATANIQKPEIVGRARRNVQWMSVTLWDEIIRELKSQGTVGL